VTAALQRWSRDMVRKDIITRSQEEMSGFESSLIKECLLKSAIF